MEFRKRIEPVIQYDSMDCGPACLSMIARYYGKKISLHSLREKSLINRQGVSLLGLSDAAESIGFRTTAVRIGFDDLKKIHLPCIIHWDQNHFVVLDKIKSKKGLDYIYVCDPASGLVIYTKQEFEQGWISSVNDNINTGIALILQPTIVLFNYEEEKKERKDFGFIFSYLKSYRVLIKQLFYGLLAGSLIQTILPFLTQSIVDQGISNNDLSFITLILIAQLFLIISSSCAVFLRGWIILHLGTRINVSLISDFLSKLMKLPMGYFDSKQTGDLLQRINDHERIEDFLTNSGLNTAFSMLNIIFFGIILLIYNKIIFAIFIIGSLLYIFWIKIFMKQRKDLDFKFFSKQSKNQGKLVELITGMQEVKLHGCETSKRWEWENIQASIFKIRIKGLAIRQYQDSGAVLINQSKNILITALSAGAVLKSEMTLGMMLSVQFIIGQLNAPVEQLVSFFRSLQDAKLSLNRLSEIHNQKGEDEKEDLNIVNDIGREIKVENLNFSYDGYNQILDNINLEIPKGKITAIVGMSGSGKTTIIKLLLGYYNNYKGRIIINNENFNQFNMKSWRSICGTVMQEGMLFSDTIASNIAPGEEVIDRKKLQEAARIANIHEFILSLPLAYNTKIGQEGISISQGQKQRILIARAVYKNPDIIFLDEATNALDSNNEKEIMERLDTFFCGRTVIVVAHRLSTVRKADQIIVIDKGRIIETGKHDELVLKQGAYYTLVKNQLEL